MLYNYLRYKFFSSKKMRHFKSIMIIQLLLSVVVMSNVAAIDVQGQNETIRISKKNVIVRDVLKDVESKSNYRFFFSDDFADIYKVVSVDLESADISELLSALFHESTVTYKLLDNNVVVITPIIEAQQAQQGVTITGTVVDANDGNPIPGVNISIKGSTVGTSTDFDGRYSVTVPNKDVILVFSYVGYVSQEIKVGDQKEVVIRLTEDIQLIDEVIVIGYMSQKRGLLTGAVSTMNVSESIERIPTTSAGNILSGMMAGVSVNTPRGYAGNGNNITIRTASSWNSQPATFVLDGVIISQTDFNNLSPSEIENITVLKDAAAAAVYGSRSAGGVILVTTKKGNVGKPVFKYSFDGGVNTRTKNAGLTNAIQAGRLYMRINGNADPAGWHWGEDELDYFQNNINNGWGYNQLDEVWRNPYTISHNLSASGGTDKVKYYAGFSYIKQQDFLDPVYLDKYNMRLNITADLTNELQLFAGMAMNYNKRSNSTWGDDDIYGKLLIWQPDQPIYTESGKHIDYGWISNLGAAMDGAEGYNREEYLKPTMQVSLTYNVPFIKGLGAKAMVDYAFSDTYYKNYEIKYDMMIMKRTGTHGRIYSTKDEDIVGTSRNSRIANEYLTARNTRTQAYQMNFQLFYDRTFEQHHVQGTLVYEKYYGKGGGFNGRRETFPVYRIDQWWAASSASQYTSAGGDSDWEDGRISYIGQFNYDYANRYLLNFSFRQDGSMKFAPDQRWGFFPAASAGWVISQEGFLADNDKLNYLKLRFSAGLTGNDNVGGWQWQQSYSSGSSAYFGDPASIESGITYGAIVNPYLTWEKSLTYNVGMDLNYFKHFSTTLEYWFRKTYDILGSRQVRLPQTFSRSMPSENYGQMNAQGFDLNIGYRNTTSGKLTYFANLNMSYGWNKYVLIDDPENPRNDQIRVGRSTNNIWGYEFDRIIRTQEELDAFNANNPGYRFGGYYPALGMMVYQDISGPNGVPDGIIDSWDLVILQKNNFPIEYGLNLGVSWKGFSIETMLSGKMKQKKSFRTLAGNVEWNRMWDEWYDNSWTPENPNAWLPKRLSANDGTRSTYDSESAFWLRNGSFARLKYLNVSYTLPKNLYFGALDRVKLYFSGANLFCLSSFNFFDPELTGGFQYPIMRTFNFGIDVTF